MNKFILSNRNAIENMLHHLSYARYTERTLFHITLGRTYSFEDCLTFLVNSGYVGLDDDMFSITLLGRDFLNTLRSQNMVKIIKGQ